MIAMECLYMVQVGVYYWFKQLKRFQKSNSTYFVSWFKGMEKSKDLLQD